MTGLILGRSDAELASIARRNNTKAWRVHYNHSDTGDDWMTADALADDEDGAKAALDAAGTYYSEAYAEEIAG